MRERNGNRVIIIWLFTGCALVAAMVVIGGITRLTHSGLSMVNWNLIMGSIPPLNEQQWQETFELYKTSPEYQKVNYHFALDDFKSIFWWEYIHRLLGRLIGLVFLIPFGYFLIRRKINKTLMIKLLVILSMGAFQGFLGWFMVKSGLIDRPAVSHYRLAAHLITALLLFAYIFWVALDLIYPVKLKAAGQVKTLRNFTIFFLALLGVQLIYGAFVAGLKAGLIMNTFPKMGGQWVHVSMGKALDEMGIAAFTEHIVIVQFIHRYLGKILFVLAIWLWWRFRKITEHYIKHALNILAGSVALQFLLGVLTLIYVVPVWLGVLHQFTAIVLLSACVYLIHRTNSMKET